MWTHPLNRLLLLSLSLAWLAGCGGESPGGGASAPPPSVGVWAVALDEVSVTRSWAGSVEPIQRIPLVAPGAGRIEEVRGQSGARVTPGELIFTLVAPELEARREVAEERLRQLESELERWERLEATGAAGAGEVAEARLRLFQARESLGEVRALSEAYRIRAPSAGTLSGLVHAPGSWVAAGAVLGHVEGPGPGGMGVRLTIPSWESASFEDPAHLRVRTESGIVYEVERVAVGSGSVSGVATVELYLRDGPTSREGVEVLHEITVHALVVPWTAVASDGDRHWVAKVVPGDPAQVERTRVELGRPFTAGVEVRAGLEEGDLVVRYEPRSHPDGRRVTPVGGVR